VAQNPNIIAASVEAYISALNGILAEEHWAGATEEAGNFRAAAATAGPRSEFDPEAGKHDTTGWFER